MADRPIVFSAPMIRALLDGRKTQTRRIIRNMPEPPAHDSVVDHDPRHAAPYFDAYCGNPKTALNPRGMSDYWCWWTRDDREGRGCKIGYAPGDRLIPAMSIPSLDRRYCADLFGNIWSRAKGEWRKLKASPTSRGYLAVTPALKGKYQTRYVHHLVCEAFYGPAPEGMQQVRHLDGDHLNNAPHNLDWGTQEQNWQDRAAHGGGMGEAHHGSKLTLEDVAAIRSSNEPQRALAARYGVSQSTIWAARSGECWKEGRQPAAPNLARWTEPATLIVTDVRVQRLQDISEEDAMAEGATSRPNCHGFRDMYPGWSMDWSKVGQHSPYASGGPGALRESDVSLADAQMAFANYWNEINGPGAWDANPWVVALSFTVHRCNIDQMEARP